MSQNLIHFVFTNLCIRSMHSSIDTGQRRYSSPPWSSSASYPTHQGAWQNLPQIGTGLVIRAGHATILPRQHDHVFRPQNCLLLQYYYFCCGNSINRHWDQNIFRIFSGPWGSITLSRCRCREAKKLLRAQLCWFLYPHRVRFVKERILLFLWNCLSN